MQRGAPKSAKEQQRRPWPEAMAIGTIIQASVISPLGSSSGQSANDKFADKQKEDACLWSKIEKHPFKASSSAGAVGTVQSSLARHTMPCKHGYTRARVRKLNSMPSLARRRNIDSGLLSVRTIETSSRDTQGRRVIIAKK